MDIFSRFSGFLSALFLCCRRFGWGRDVLALGVRMDFGIISFDVNLLCLAAAIRFFDMDAGVVDLNVCIAVIDLRVDF